MPPCAVLLSIVVLGLAPAAAAQPALSTLAERSGFLKTGRYDEVIRLCAAFQTAHPSAVRCIDFGRTPEGRPMKALVVSRSGALTPQAARRARLPVVLIQGGIHAGEIDGKDAGFWALRDVLDLRAVRGALDRQVLLFVPVFNVDGHERFGRWNRPNQRGPEATGWRTTAQNYNLNREYMKADAPEMQAMLRLVNDWDPLVVIDLHATNGAKFEHDVAIMVQPAYVGDEALRTAGLAFRSAVIADLASSGSLPLPFYPSFVRDDDPSSGVVDGVPPPRLSHGYFLLRNRLAMLVETHSWKDYPTRVQVTRNVVLSVLDQIARHGRHWRRLAQEADTRAATLGGEPVPLSYRATEQSREIEFRGYAYTRTVSEISGALMTRYDESRPELWKIPLRDQIEPNVVVNGPQAGYLVPAAQAQRVRRAFDLHGIRYTVLTAPIAQAAVETFRATKTTPAARPNESRQRMAVEGEWQSDRRDIRAGALFAPIAQGKARLLMALLEPKAPDSLLAWGDFNIAFERREYMEPYVAEEVAREQLQADSSLAAAFQKRVAEDAEFAKSPAARLDFFYQRHPSWDEQFNLYPVFRANFAPR
jgi:hypothetical protein